MAGEVGSHFYVVQPGIGQNLRHGCALPGSDLQNQSTARAQPLGRADGYLAHVSKAVVVGKERKAGLPLTHRRPHGWVAVGDVRRVGNHDSEPTA